MTVTEFLIETKRLLLERGWCKHVATDGRGRVCLGYALFEAGYDEYPEMFVAACRAIERAIVSLRLDAHGFHERLDDVRDFCVPEWNDSSETAEADVHRVLDLAIINSRAA